MKFIVWIMKILGRPSEEELAQRVHDIAEKRTSERFRVGDRICLSEGEEVYVGDRIYLSEGEEGYAEARQLLGSYAARGFQEHGMYLECLPDLRIRDTHELGWVSNGWTRIIVHLGKTYPKV